MLKFATMRVLGIAVLTFICLGLLGSACSGDGDDQTSVDSTGGDVVDVAEGGDSAGMADADMVAVDNIEAPSGPCPSLGSYSLPVDVESAATWDVHSGPLGIVVAAVAENVVTVGYLPDEATDFTVFSWDTSTWELGSAVAVAVAGSATHFTLVLAFAENPHMKVFTFDYAGLPYNEGAIQTVTGLGETAQSLRLTTVGEDTLGLVAVSGSAVPTAYGFVLSQTDGKKLHGPIVLGSSVVVGIAEAVTTAQTLAAVFYTATPSPRIVRSTFGPDGKLIDTETILADQTAFGPIEPSFGAFGSTTGVTLSLFAKTDGTPIPRGGYLAREIGTPLMISDTSLWTAAAVASAGDDVFAAWRAEGLLWGQWLDADGTPLEKPLELGATNGKASQLRTVAKKVGQYGVFWGTSSGIDAELVQCSAQ